MLSYAQVDVQVLDKEQPQLLAVRNGQLDMYKLLKEHPRTRPLKLGDRFSQAELLHAAAFDLDWDIVEHLLRGDEGIPHDCQDQDKSSQEEMTDRASKDIAILAALLKDRDFAVNRQNLIGQTLLHLIATYGRHHLVEELLDCSRLQPNLTDCLGRTALYYTVGQGYQAAKYGQSEDGCHKYVATAKQLLRDHRVDVKISVPRSAWCTGGSPLQLARKWGNAEIINLLLQRGAKDEVVGENDVNMISDAENRSEIQDNPAAAENSDPDAGARLSPFSQVQQTQYLRGLEAGL